MSGETNLNVLLASLSADLIEGTYVLVTVLEANMPEGISSRMVFREREGITLIILQEEAEQLGLAFEFPSRMITLNIHSSLEAVGFMARIVTELAKEDMGVNPVAGFYHDHLFVPEDRALDAMRVLDRIAKDAA